MFCSVDPGHMAKLNTIMLTSLSGGLCGQPQAPGGYRSYTGGGPLQYDPVPRCSGYYTLPQGEEVSQGRGRCGECREEVPAAKHLPDNNTWLEDSGRTSGSQTDEDMKVFMILVFM